MTEVENKIFKDIIYDFVLYGSVNNKYCQRWSDVWTKCSRLDMCWCFRTMSPYILGQCIRIEHEVDGIQEFK